MWSNPACAMGHSWTSNATGPCRVEQSSARFLSLNCILLGCTFLVGVPSNLLVCWLVLRNKTLQTANNALLVNLAAGDLLRCLVDSPLFLASLLLGASPLCSTQQFTFALCSCAQLLGLVAISVERYRAIAFPFRTQRRTERTRTWILLVWVVSFFIAILSLSLSEDPPSYMMCRNLNSPKLRTDPFGACVLVPIWTVCIVIITFHYLRIFIVVRRHASRVFDVGVQPRASIAKLPSGWPSLAASAPWTAPAGLPESSAGAEGGSQWDEPDTPPRIIGAVCVLTPKAKELGKKRLEGKLAKRLGYIIIAVILFWLPLVLILVLDEFVDCTQSCGGLLGGLYSSASVVSCVPAAVDPLIYTLLQRHFRTHLHKLFSTKPHC
ncbi:D(4) dopamine receptor-like [Colossoma macropomum]|uniref:D(4) dopamine receptor-like n=1 Tax=Colossoma macropomum TaxID=42526 RepID=UPI00186520B6|nr:D(4) dopamine receptor-like [Colossoma macropomum]